MKKNSINIIIILDNKKSGGNIKPISVNQVWHRRVCTATFAISLAIVILFCLNQFILIPNQINSVTINIYSLLIASVSLVLSAIFFFWTPTKSKTPYSTIIYLLLIALTISFIFETQSSSSIYIAIWAIISFLAGIFGVWGILLIFILSFIYASMQYLNGNLSLSLIISLIFCAIIPLIISAFYQKNKNQEASEDTKKFNNKQDELNELTSRSEVIINAIGDGVVTINSNGLIQLINPAAQELIGWSKQDAINLNYKSVLQLVNQKNEELNAQADPIQQVLNTNQQVRTNNLSLVTKTGKKLIASLVVSPVGELGSGIIAVFHDITSEKAEEREQAEFISTASHEMRTPVASIEGYLGLALNPQTAQVDDRARDYIQKAHESAQHLGHLFQDLLDVSKADDGRMSNNPKVINIVTFLHDITLGLKAKASAKSIKLVYKPIPDDNVLDKNIAPVFLVNLDNDHIREVMDNLIENAIKYTPQGEILIDVTGDEDRVVVSIKDSGIGIPAEDMSHLFQKFYRVDNKNTRDIGGTGLGLYLSRRLVELMDGRIWAESVYNQGSTFFVELPRINSQEAAQITEQEAIKEQSGLTLANETTTQIPVDKSAIANENSTTISNPTTNINQAPITTQNNVPRGQALSAEQIAEYVAKQRQLAAQQSAQTNPQTIINPSPTINRGQTVSIPNREQK